jgi:hypothetical protein
MGRILAMWVMGVVCGGFWASGVGAQDDVPRFSADGDHKANQKILEAIQKPLPEGGLEFSETALEEIVEYLRDEYKIEIQFDRQALEDLGIDVGTPITIKVHDISLRAALRLMLKDLEMTYVISDEVLLLTTEEEADSRCFVCVYPVHDLIDPNYQRDEDPKKPIFPYLSPPEFDSIISVLVLAVANDTWDYNGKGEASISGMRPGLLVVYQTQNAHEQIRNTLTAIRSAKQFAEQNQPAAETTLRAENSPEVKQPALR